MTTTTPLDRRHRHGVRLRIDDGRPRWFAPVGVVTDADLSALRQHKAEVLAILREAESDRIEERSAIVEVDAHLSRREAECRARNEQHPANGGNAA